MFIKYIYIHIIYTGWWFGTFLLFHIYGIILPIDELIFFRGVDTTNQYIYIYM